MLNENDRAIKAKWRSRRGIILAEVVVSIPILGLVVALAAAGILNYQRSRLEVGARQAAAWAAAAQLQRLQAGAPLDSLPPHEVISAEVQLKTTATPGQAEWKGFQLVTVVGTVALNDRKKVSEQISAYVPAEVKP